MLSSKHIEKEPLDAVDLEYDLDQIKYYQSRTHVI